LRVHVQVFRHRPRLAKAAGERAQETDISTMREAVVKGLLGTSSVPSAVIER
jgi:hypothetical protein